MQILQLLPFKHFYHSINCSKLKANFPLVEITQTQTFLHLDVSQILWDKKKKNFISLWLQKKCIHSEARFLTVGNWSWKHGGKKDWNVSQSVWTQRFLNTERQIEKKYIWFLFTKRIRNNTPILMNIPRLWWSSAVWIKGRFQGCGRESTK